MRALVFLLALAALLLPARASWAADAFLAAELADAEFRFRDAVAGYDLALSQDAASPKAMRAFSRTKFLKERSEGDFAPLIMLERIRRDPALASDGRTIDDLVRAADGFPKGLVRVEAWALAAEAYAHRLERVDQAAPLWEKIRTDPYSDLVLVQSSARSLAFYRLERRDYAGARAAADVPDATLKRDVARVVRRHYLHVLAIALLGLLIAFGARALVRRRDVLRPSAGLILGYAIYVAASGAILASRYEDGTGMPFLLYGVVLVPILFVARAWGAAGSPIAWRRGLRAALCASSALAAAFLVLEHVDVAYLEGLGL